MPFIYQSVREVQIQRSILIAMYELHIVLVQVEF